LGQTDGKFHASGVAEANNKRKALSLKSFFCEAGAFWFLANEKLVASQAWIGERVRA
jgi:hypothetical protein